ncbi:MAG: PEP-CTERM sorting domain-containing protein [Burkholderiaceae bacterium]
MSIRTLVQGLAAGVFVLSGAAFAAPITGTPIGGTYTWVGVPQGAPAPASTNLANYTLSEDGTARPHVLFSSADIGSVTLDFYNLAAGLAFFEVRIDGVATGSTAHPIVTGDTIHAGGVSVVSGAMSLDRTFSATQYVDIRLALGGEADYRFDWTRFEVLASNDVPLPGTLLLLGLGGLGAGLTLRRRR